MMEPCADTIFLNASDRLLPVLCDKMNSSNTSSLASVLPESHEYTTRIFKAPLWQTNFPEALVYCILTLFIIVVGTLGNIAIIVINVLDNTMNNIGRIFIINIAIGDICVSAIAEPVCIIGVYYGEQWFDSYWFACEAVAILCYIACIGSYLSFVLRTFNRYIFLCHNHLYYDIYSTNRAILACFICWVIAAIMDSANLIGWGDHSFDQKSHRCVWDRNASFSYTMAIGAVLLIPLPPTVACFILIFKEIFKRKMSIYSFSEGGNSWRLQGLKESLRASRTLLIGFIVYLVLWAPAGILIMVDFADRIDMAVYLFTVQLAHFHSCADFIIDLCVDRKFRKNLYNLITKRRGPVNSRKANYRHRQRQLEQKISCTSTSKQTLTPKTSSSTLESLKCNSSTIYSISS